MSVEHEFISNSVENDKKRDLIHFVYERRIHQFIRRETLLFYTDYNTEKDSFSFPSLSSKIITIIFYSAWKCSLSVSNITIRLFTSKTSESVNSLFREENEFLLIIRCEPFFPKSLFYHSIKIPPSKSSIICSQKLMYHF